jgi:catalase (peroxidase I)
MPEEHLALIEKTVAKAAEAAAKAVVEAAQASALVLAQQHTDTATSITALQCDMRALQRQQSDLEIGITKKIDVITNDFKGIRDALDDIAKGRPTWAVTSIITILSTISGSLIVGICVYMLNH